MTQTDYDKVKPLKKDETIDPKEVQKETVKEDTKLKPVGHAVKQKKGLGRKITSAFLGEDGIRSVGQYLAQDVLIPAIKDLIVSSVQNGISAMVYGKDQSPRGSHYSGYKSYSGGYSTNRTNYSTSYRPGPNNAPNQAPYRKETRAGRFRSDDYVLKDRQEALDVLDQLRDQIDTYGWTSLADFFDLVGIDTNYTDNNYGWSDLSSATITVARGGYTLRLPKLEPLKG